MPNTDTPPSELTVLAWNALRSSRGVWGILTAREVAHRTYQFEGLSHDGKSGIHAFAREAKFEGEYTGP